MSLPLPSQTYVVGTKDQFPLQIVKKDGKAENITNAMIEVVIASESVGTVYNAASNDGSGLIVKDDPVNGGFIFNVPKNQINPMTETATFKYQVQVTFDYGLDTADTQNFGEGDFVVHPSFANVPPVSADFSISVTPPSQDFVAAGESHDYLVTLQSISGLAGSVVLGVTISPTDPNQPTVAFVPGTVPLTADGTGLSTMTVTTTALTPPGTYGIVVTGTLGIHIHAAGAIAVALP